jgi:pyrroline-5-carboxylate reductase
MADALLSGFLEKRAFLKENILVSDCLENRLEYMNKKFGVKTTLENKALAEELQIIILAVKPQIMDIVLQEIAPFVNENHLLISIAAGYPISKMENFLGTDKRLVRVMPNTPCKYGVGTSGFCLGKNATQEDSDSVKLMFDSVGLSYQVTETQLDAVIGVSGSGPAYVFLFIEALADGGVKMGLPRDIALKLAAQNVMGAAKMVLETG